MHTHTHAHPHTQRNCLRSLETKMPQEIHVWWQNGGRVVSPFLISLIRTYLECMNKWMLNSTLFVWMHVWKELFILLLICNIDMGQYARSEFAVFFWEKFMYELHAPSVHGVMSRFGISVFVQPCNVTSSHSHTNFQNNWSFFPSPKWAASLRGDYTMRFGNFILYCNFLMNSLKFIKVYIIKKGISQGRQLW